MNLNGLKNLVYKQETTEGVVTSKRYEPPKRFGLGLGTLAPANWHITVEDEAGLTYEMTTNRLDFFDPDELDKDDKVKVTLTRIIGIYVRKIERRR